MNNLHPTKDKIKTPQCNNTEINHIRNKIQHLQFWLKQIELSYEGHLRSSAYANADIQNGLRNEGEIQQREYNVLFGKALEKLGEICQEMHSNPTSDAEGK